MTFNPVGAAAVLASVLAFALSWRFTKSLRPTTRFLVLLLFSLLSLPGVLFSVYYLHILPEQAWFYYLRSFPGSEFLAIFIGCAAGCLASFLPNFLMGFPLFGVIAFTAIPYLKPVFSPIPDEDLLSTWDGDTCLQSTLSTCGLLRFARYSSLSE